MPPPLPSFGCCCVPSPQPQRARLAGRGLGEPCPLLSIDKAKCAPPCSLCCVNFVQFQKVRVLFPGAGREKKKRKIKPNKK